MQRPTIGFIGLGAMGEPMAARLLDAGFRVVSSVNRSRDAIERLAVKGIEERETPREVGEHADILMTMVWDEEQTDRVLRGEGGALSTLREGAMVVVMSTVSPVYCQELAREAASSGVDVIDCPVSGLEAGARDGTLTLLAGGGAATIERCREAFDVLGATMHCGDIGAGQAMKLGNNAVAIGTWALVQEVREVVGAYGMDSARFLKIGLRPVRSSTEQFSVLAFAKIPGIFVALPLAAWMTRRFDKKPTVIDRADRENGCLFYVKGTHRQDLPSVVGLEGFSAGSEEAVAVEVEPGDATIHSSRTVHWPEANRSERPRQAIRYFYWAASCTGPAHSGRTRS